MEITRLSSKGQVIIPKTLRNAHQWKTGQEFIAIDVGDGILLKPKNPFPETKLEDIEKLPAYTGKPKTIKEMDDAIDRAIREEWNDSGRH